MSPDRSEPPGLGMSVRWCVREQPLPPLAVVGRGVCARRLAERIIGRTDLVGVVGAGLLVALGPELPWVDGVEYLGAEPDAPHLLFDCRVAPSVSASILSSAVRARVPGRVAWLSGPSLLVPLARAEAFHAPAWASGWRDEHLGALHG